MSLTRDLDLVSGEQNLCIRRYIQFALRHSHQLLNSSYQSGTLQPTCQLCSVIHHPDLLFKLQTEL